MDRAKTPLWAFAVGPWHLIVNEVASPAPTACDKRLRGRLDRYRTDRPERLDGPVCPKCLAIFRLTIPCDGEAAARADVGVPIAAALSPGTYISELDPRNAERTT